MAKLIAIRPIEAADEADVQRYASDPRLAATCNVPCPYPPNGAQQFLDRAIAGRASGRHYVFAVLADGHFAGLMTLNAVNIIEGTAHLDYWIAVPFWGQGIGTAGAGLAMEFAFRRLGLGLLRSGCLVANPASARILEKNGFSPVGIFINEGTYGSKFSNAQIMRYELRREDWEARVSLAQP